MTRAARAAYLLFSISGRVDVSRYSNMSPDVLECNSDVAECTTYYCSTTGAFWSNLEVLVSSFFSFLGCVIRELG